MATESIGTASLLEHCVARAVLAFAREDVESGRRKASDTPTVADFARAGASSMRTATRVAAFVIFWTMALGDRGDRITIEDFAAEGYMSRATAYRRLKDFQQLFPEFHDPHDIAAQLLAATKGRPSPATPLELAAA